MLSVRPDLQQIFDVKLTSLKLKMVSILKFPNLFSRNLLSGALTYISKSFEGRTDHEQTLRLELQQVASMQNETPIYDLE